MINENEDLSLIKLVSGEEIISMVSSIEEDDLKLLLLNHPCKITTIKNTNGKDQGVKFDHWMKFSEEYVFTINFNKVITMTIVQNPQLKFLYKKFIDKYGDQEINHTKDNYYEIKPNRDLGLLGNVDDVRDKLESLFNSKSISSI
jgi:hypothetical protein